MNSTANDGVFRCLKGRGEASRDEESVAPVDPKHDYYWDSGAHPDVVQRLWNQLGKGSPAESRALLFGTPALVHPESGIVLAFAWVPSTPSGSLGRSGQRDVLAV